MNEQQVEESSYLSIVSAEIVTSENNEVKILEMTSLLH
jgi:hypothetical protein